MVKLFFFKKRDVLKNYVLTSKRPMGRQIDMRLLRMER